MIRSDETPENLARRFHETYERLAPQFGYTTAEASRVPWGEVPETNKALMIAVCAEILAPAPPPQALMGTHAEPTPAQRAIVVGCYFARPDRAARCIEFGEVVEAEPDPDDTHWRIANVWSSEAPSPQTVPRKVLRHVGDLAPLTAEQFEIARAAGWDTSDALARTPEGRKVITAVFTDPRWEGDRT